MGINGASRRWIRGRSIPALVVLVIALGVFPRPARTQAPPPDAQALMERVLAFSRAHPRARGRFHHTYFDRARSMELHNRGTFVVQIPRARIEIEGDEARSISVDETFARVLVPDGAAPLVLSFRLETTPLPSLFALLGGSVPTADLFSVRRIEAPGDPVLELRPIDPAAMVDRLWLEVAADGSVSRILVVDVLGGTHRIVLDGARYPASIPDSAFALDVPAGAVAVEP